MFNCIDKSIEETNRQSKKVAEPDIFDAETDILGE